MQSIMSPLFTLFLSVILTLHPTTSQPTYPFKTWMQDWSSSEALAHHMSIATSTIYDIVLPGAHNAGMSFSSSDAQPMTSPSLQDSYVNTLNSLPSVHAQKQWAQRQTGSISELLKSGVRFLDLQFLHENSTDTFYAYNGLLGRSITDIITDITGFLRDTGTEELILIYLHDFIYSQSIAFIDDQLSTLLDAFATDTFLAPKLANTITHNLRSRTIGDLIHTDGVQVILFTDQYPTTYSNRNYFYDADTYLFLPKYEQGSANATFVKGQLDEVSEVRSFVISNLRYGWPQDKLNLIYWTLDIGVSFTEQHVYDSMMDFSSRLNNELNNVLNTYRKLWFANIIVVDFFEISDVMEQLLLLNHDYTTCNDTMWGNNATGCPALTDLKSKYSASGTSPMCEINTDLQTDCQRSCGVCASSAGGNPGDRCTSNADCDGILFGYYADSVGECFMRPNTTRAQDNIHLESFCLTVDAQSSCANKDIQDKCGNQTALDISNCNQHCSADWQCQDGFCNPKYSVCMTLLEPNTTSEPPASSNSDEKYDFIVSSGAEQMLLDVAMFRPGDYKAAPSVEGLDGICDSPSADCVTAGMDASPYLASLLGFAIIPFFMAITLCFCYTLCCCPCWCCCDKCAKKCCCCHLVMKNPMEEDAHKWKQYPPLIVLAICLIIVVWACIEGIVNNAEMHDHIFGERNSVAFAVNNLFDEVIGRFEAIEPTAGYIIDSGVGIMNDIFGILEGSTDSVALTLDQLYAKLDLVAAKYANGTSLSAQFVNPFGSTNGSDFSIDDEFVINCDYCDGISDQALEMKHIINGSLGQALGSVDALMNQTRGFVDAKDTIKNLTSQLFDTLHEVINTSHTIQTTANEYIDMGKEYDQTYREQPAQIFFIVPMGLILFVVLGVVLKNKWCFKLEWFCAMYCCGIPIMLLSWPFIFFAVLWGDVCVRLDDFEQNLAHSQVGHLAGLDAEDIAPNDPRAQGLALVNTCWHGGSPLDMFNLTQNLDWDMLRGQLDSVLDIDLTSMLDSADIASFQTGIDTLSIGEFEGKVDSFIAHANSLGAYCGCGERNSPFTWTNLYNPPDFDYCARYVPPNKTLPIIPTLPGNVSLGYLADTRTFYWFNTTSSDHGECELAYVNASAAVQIYTVLTDEANNKVAELKGLFGDAVFDSYDDLFRIASDLELDVSKISCLIEPLFEQFDVIIDNFTNCGFLGEAYGNFKEAGCVNLFDDWYKIARAMAVVAYISIMIVFMSLCMDYVYGPIQKKDVFGDDEVFVDGDDAVPLDMAPVGHENAASTLELQPGMVATVVPTSSFSPGSVASEPGTVASEPGQVQPPMVMVVPQQYPAPVVAQSVNSYSGAPLTIQQTQTYAAMNLAISPMAPSYQHPKPERAESEAQSYMIEYDNEPDLPADVPESFNVAPGNEGGFVGSTEEPDPDQEDDIL